MRYPALLAICAVAVALRLPAFFQPAWYLDEGIFAAIADVWRHGGALYADAWDNKPPGIFAVYALGWSTGLDMVAVRLLDLGAMLGVIAIVYTMARRAGGEAAGLAAAAVAGLLLGLPTIEGHIANTESFLVLFTSLGMYLVVRGVAPAGSLRMLGMAGLAFGGALLFKQTAAFDVLAASVFLVMVYRAEDWRRAGWFVAGVCALPLATGLAFLVAGHFGDLWSATVTSLAGYRQDSPSTGAERYLVALMPMAIAVPYALSLRPWQTRAPEALFVLWLAFTALALAASGRSYPHYLLQMTPPFALTVGLLAFRHGARVPRSSVALGQIAACLVLAYVVLGPLPNVAWNREPDFTRAYYANFLDYASGDIDRDAHDAFFDSRAFAHLGLYEQVEDAGLRSQPAFVWGDVPWLYTRAGLDSPTRYTTLLNAVEAEEGVRAVATLLLDVKPQYILVMEESRASWEEVQPLLREEYAPVREMLWCVLYARQPSPPVD